ncbi:MAG: histidine kinase dimerization/phospho-acceptor domain-containing protein, partial [Sphingobium sp.]
MNRLTITQITASCAVLRLGIAGALLAGAQLREIVFPVVAGLLILLIASPDDQRPAVPAPATEPEQPELLRHPDLPAMLETISDPLMLIERGRITRANRAAQRLLGTHIEGVDARVAIRHPAAAERLSSLAPMAEPAIVELIGIGTREQRWQMRVAPVGTAADNARLVHLVDRSLAYAAERMRVDFVANASHELRTPLASLTLSLETILGPARDNKEDSERFLKLMQVQAERMRRLIDDLLSLSRIELDEHIPPSDRADIAQVARETADILA